MQVICPKCQSELQAIGQRCPNDGWFGVASDELLTGDHIVGRPLGESFVALKKIGQGGMGTVYEGKQIQFERTVAVKVLSKLHLTDPQIIARFEREAKSIARVIHPNVVQLIDSGVENGDIAYIVMEYVKGVELSNLPPSEITASLIIHITNQILNALSEAHSMNVIHRDLKPDNIMLCQEDGDNHFVKVLDFGLASLTDRAKITISGQALGTPWYMSPEQATATSVTTASDIYSLGCILYELVTSKPPFPGTRPFNVMMQHVNAQVPPIVPREGLEISDKLSAFINRCLEKKPEDRYQTAKEALQALYALPEWLAVGQKMDPTQSLRLSMSQLSEMNRLKSEVSSITSALDEINIRPRTPSTSRSVSLALSPDPAEALDSPTIEQNLASLQNAAPNEPPAVPHSETPSVPLAPTRARLDPNVAFRRLLIIIAVIAVLFIATLLYLIFR